MISMPTNGADDIRQIQDLQRRHARLTDVARWHEAAALFTEDGSFTRPSDPAHPLVGREAILQAFLARPARAGRRHHLVADPVVELLDATTARAHCVTVLLTDLGEGRGTISVGTFLDKLTKVEGQWRFQSRVGSTSVPPAPCEMQEPLFGPAGTE
ncbi:hypothetical protein CDEF62S_05553 [Castellaniella defragrans]